MYICNAFSLNMVNANFFNLSVEKIDKEEVVKETLESAIGHADTAAIVSKDLGADLPANRVSISLGPHDVMIVAQYIGPRLAEGTTELPEGAKIEYRRIKMG